MKYFKKIKHYSAQSLIEAIVAIYIIVLAAVAILSVGLNYLILGGQTRERIIAINLAREGLGVVRSIRNSNWLDPSQSWPYGIIDGDHLVNFYSNSLDIIADDSDITLCNNCALCQQTDGYYTHCVGGKYKRLITISNGNDLGINCDNNCEKKIISTVYWVDHVGEHTINVEARLTNWR